MRVLVAGATGALGHPLVRRLVANGDEVIAASRSLPPGPSREVAQVRLDILDEAAVTGVVSSYRPDAIVHLATSIPHHINPRVIGRQFCTTNRLRTEGTRNLLVAAANNPGTRFIAQGLAYAYAPGDAVRSEQDPLWPAPPRTYAPVVAALRAMEAMVQRAGGTVLRIGHIYGPGTIYAADGSLTEVVRRAKAPIVGEGRARFSFVHVDDVAAAVVTALGHDRPGVFNIVDDQPLYVREWLPWFARQLGAPPPKRVPPVLARLAVGRFGVVFMDELAGASNQKARAGLGWTPSFASFRDGAPAGPGQTEAA